MCFECGGTDIDFCIPAGYPEEPTMTATLLFQQGQSVASICRLCFMERDQLELIFDPDHGYVTEWIEKLTTVKLVHVPNAPASLCAGCKSTLETFDVFRDMCITNDLMFKETFCQEPTPESLAADEIKIESVEGNVVDVGQDVKVPVVVGKIPDTQEGNDATVTNMVFDNFEIKVHDMGAGVGIDMPMMAMVRIGEGNEIALDEHHDTAAMLQLPMNDSTLDIAGREIDIDSSVESESETLDDAQIAYAAKENSDVLAIIEDALTDVCKYYCEVCNIHVSKLHILTHKGPQYFRCYVCLKEFPRFNYVSKHTAKWHRRQVGEVVNNTEGIRNEDQINSDENEHAQLDSYDLVSAFAPTSEVAVVGDYKIIISGQDMKVDPDVEEDMVVVEQQAATAPSISKADMSDYSKYHCKLCKKNTTKLHKITHKAKGVFQCYVCHKKFKKMDYCSKHIKTHLNKQKTQPTTQTSTEGISFYTCKICMKSVSKMHAKTHKAKGLYLCYICRRKFDTMKDVAKHVRSHMKLRKQQDEQITLGHLYEERKSDSKISQKSKKPAPFNHNCQICHKIASKLHLMTHKAEGLFECSFCPKTFDKFQYVSKHIKLHARKEKNAYFDTRKENTNQTTTGSEKSDSSRKSRETSSNTYDMDDDVVVVKVEEPVLHIDSDVEDEDVVAIDDEDDINEDDVVVHNDVVIKDDVNQDDVVVDDDVIKDDVNQDDVAVDDDVVIKDDINENNVVVHNDVVMKDGVNEDDEEHDLAKNKEHHRKVDLKQLDDDRDMHLCKICNKTVSKMHANTHKAHELFKCPFCRKTFAKFSNTSMHIKCHIERNKCVCGVCKKSFSGPYKLNLHKKWHSH